MKLHLPISKLRRRSQERSADPKALGEASSSDEPPHYKNFLDEEFSSLGISNTVLEASTISNSHQSTEYSDNKNQPYRPTAELQKYIDALGTGSTTPRNLTSYSTNARTDYFDVLPSFELYQSILRRNDAQFSESLTENPPRYGDTLNSSPTPPLELSPQVSNASQRNIGIDAALLDGDAVPEYSVEREREQNSLASDSEGQNFELGENSNELGESAFTSHDSYGNTVLDAIDRLPVLRESPIDIDIYVTKKVPRPHFANELETRLKEYTTGDLVNGYIIIKNHSDKPVHFGLFIVSLEGTIKAVKADSQNGLLDVPKIKRVLGKKFLKMYDLNASSSETAVPNSAGIEYDVFAKDSFDGCSIGLPNERILEPHAKYKKFFTFKFPDKLLDNNCINNVSSHNFPPPSFGLDRTCFHNRGYSITLNKALGYGFLNNRGAPLLVKDYGFDDLSVSYTIEAKFIDRLDKSSMNNAVSANEINDPRSEAKYVVSKNAQYFLRFVPDSRNRLAYYSLGSLYDMGVSNSVGLDARFYNDYHNCTSWKLINEYYYRIEREIENQFDRKELNDETIKNKNLQRVQNPNLSLEHLDEKEVYHIPKGLLDKFQNRRLQDQRMLMSYPVDVYGKKKKKILSSLIQIGKLQLCVKIPNDEVPYSAPKLILKYNYGLTESGTSELGLKTVSSTSDLSQKLPSLSLSLDSLNNLVPVASLSQMPAYMTSSSQEALKGEFKSKTASVEIELLFTPFESSIKPPPISSIEFNLVHWSFRSDYPIPIELGYDFFYCENENDGFVNSDNVDIIRRNLQYIKERAQRYIELLKETSLHVSNESYSFLNSMSSLSIKKDTIKQYFRSIIPSTYPELENKEGWQITQRPGKKLEWRRTLSVPLMIVNRNNITVPPSFQSCLAGRVYCLQVYVKYKGSGNESNEFADNLQKIDVPIFVG